MHLQLTRGGGAVSVERVGKSESINVPVSSQVIGMQGGDGDDAKAYQNGGDVTMANVGNAQVEDPFQRKVLQIIETMAAVNDGEGVSIDAITRRLSSVPKDKIRCVIFSSPRSSPVLLPADMSLLIAIRPFLSPSVPLAMR